MAQTQQVEKDSRPSPTESTRHSWFSSGKAIVLYIAAASFLAHMLTAGRYGYFRDELYYLACARHLAFGYVDQPSLIAAK